MGDGWTNVFYMLYGAALCAGLLLTRLVMKEALVMMKESSRVHSDLEVRSTSSLTRVPPTLLCHIVTDIMTDGGSLAVAWSAQTTEGAAAAGGQGRRGVARVFVPV